MHTPTGPLVCALLLACAPPAPFPGQTVDTASADTDAVADSGVRDRGADDSAPRGDSGPSDSGSPGGDSGAGHTGGDSGSPGPSDACQRDADCGDPVRRKCDVFATPKACFDLTSWADVAVSWDGYRSLQGCYASTQGYRNCEVSRSPGTVTLRFQVGDTGTVVVGTQLPDTLGKGTFALDGSRMFVITEADPVLVGDLRGTWFVNDGSLSITEWDVRSGGSIAGSFTSDATGGASGTRTGTVTATFRARVP
ncbi:MAG: hypothetical protein H6732_03345 [Alphaproteobacteria bacterium]|nr:hypothetical protein [Alphaproteobacteria bacterium]